MNSMGSGVLLILGIAGLVMLAAFAASVAWVWRDANRRGQPGFIVAVLAAVPFWPLSLLVWVLVRPEPTQGSVIPAVRVKLVAVVISVLLMILGMLSIVLPSWLRDRARTAEQDILRSACCDKLVQVTSIYRLYALANKTPPKTFDDLRDELKLKDELLYCPAAGNSTEPSYRLIPGTNATDLIIIENPRNHGGQGSHVVYGDGMLDWTRGRPISIQAVASAIEKQLAPQMREMFGKVGVVTYDAKRDCYNAEVFWKAKGQHGRTVMVLKGPPTARCFQYTGMLQLGTAIENSPFAALQWRVTVDELRDNTDPTTSRKGSRGL